MTAITAAMVNELRQRTKAGIMDCKKYLTKAEGDIAKAEELMRKDGGAKAAKKAGRTAAEGLVAVSSHGDTVGMVEVNCETDFVARGDDFKSFVSQVVKRVVETNESNVEALGALGFEQEGGTSLSDTVQTLIAKIGENIQVRRAAQFQKSAGGSVASYLHGGRIGVIVSVSTDDEELARDIAMHVAATSPEVILPEQVDQSLVAKEKEIFEAQAAASGKPAEIIQKMVDGRIRKFLDEVSLVGQPFVKDPNQTVGKLLKSKNAEVLGFVRFEVGEGIEKKQENFAEEVMAQAGRS